MANAQAANFNYSSIGNTPIPDGPSSNTCGTAITRNISVSDSFIIDDLNVGLIANHTYKEDLWITLTSPLGTSVDIFDIEGGSFDNLNIRLDDQIGTPIGNIDHIVSEPYPEYTRVPTNPLSAFNTEDAQGTWTLTVRDCWVADTGNLLDVFLEFSGTVLSPLVVTSTADSNTVGTLRYAINHANSNAAEDAITFNIPGLGPHVIAPTSALPTITDDGISIDGSTQGSVVCNGTPNATGGMSNRKHYIALLGNNHTDNALNISGASNVTIKGLTIGNSAQNGLNAVNANGLTLLCNHIGASTDTTSSIGNIANGAFISNSDNLILGDGTLDGANIFGFNGGFGAEIDDSDNAVVKRNFFGTGADGASDIGNSSDGLRFTGSSTNITIGDATGGGNILSGNGSDGLDLANTTSATILGNYIGSNGIGTATLSNGDDGINLVNASSISIGNGTIAGRNVIGANNDDGILFFGSTIANVDNNLIGIGTGGQALANDTGIRVSGTSVATIQNNTITNSVAEGVELDSADARAAILQNSIYSNGGIGIDLNTDNFTTNDTNDSDSGPNDLLNFPVINEVSASGSTSMTYDITLDVPTNTPGYRIDFFKNTAADPTGYGEGEVFLGAIDVGGAGTHTGTFTADVSVNIGDNIAATTTRKTGTLTYDITSEFSQNATAIDANPASLTVAKTVAPLNSGDYDLPGSDVVYTFAVKNEGDGAVDTDSIILIDSLPPEIIFYYGDHDGPGPSTDVVGFDETNTSLSFDPNSDALFSNGTTKPSDLSECNYTPSAGYDPNVKYVCFNPKGQMLGGDPNPNFNIRFRARIQ